MRTSTFTWATLAVIALSLAAIGFRLSISEPTADADRYRSMTVSLVETGGFHTFDVRYPQAGEFEGGHTHYFSPLWPLFMVPFYLALGTPGFALALVAASAFALVAAWWSTQRLWGEAAALATVAALGVCLWQVSEQRGSEALALGFFVLMLHGVLRAVRPGEERWILLAGVAAGAAYLTRASVGWLFLIGGAAGFAWRLRFHRRRALNAPYLGAIALFGLAWIAWAVRNVTLFWDGTIAGLPHAVAADAVFEVKSGRAFADLGAFLLLIPLKLAWGLLLLSPFVALRWRHLLGQLRHLRDEEQSGLVLAWAVPWVTGAVVAALFTVADTSPPAPLLNVDNVRYFLFAVPGLLWGPWPLASETREPMAVAADA